MRRKRCTGCRVVYEPADKAFNRGRARCKACEFDYSQTPEAGWKAARAFLKRQEPDSLRGPYGWTKALYLERWYAAGGRCEACGAGLREWQTSGHCLDRIDNTRTHVPGNCQLLCWPCNRFKSNRHDFVFKAELGRWVDEYGRGRIPWGVLEPSIKSAERPDLSAYVVTPEQLSFWFLRPVPG